MWWLLAASLAACSNEHAPSIDDAALATPEDDAAAVEPESPDTSGLPYARRVIRFSPGSNAGFGAHQYPDVVLGPPKGGGTNEGSLDVLTLGIGGEIVLDFGDEGIIDGPGPDFIVFENAFWPGGTAGRVFADLAEVAVSDDDTTWSTFRCDLRGEGVGRYPDCAGWNPTLPYDPFDVVPLDPELTGGDVFDLATLGIASARYVRIRDLASMGDGEGDNAGFDLDAVGIIHPGPVSGR